MARGGVHPSYGTKCHHKDSPRCYRIECLNGRIKYAIPKQDRDDYGLAMRHLAEIRGDYS